MNERALRIALTCSWSLVCYSSRGHQESDSTNNVPKRSREKESNADWPWHSQDPRQQLLRHSPPPLPGSCAPPSLLYRGGPSFPTHSPQQLLSYYFILQNDDKPLEEVSFFMPVIQSSFCFQEMAQEVFGQTCWPNAVRHNSSA